MQRRQRTLLSAIFSGVLCGACSDAGGGAGPEPFGQGGSASGASANGTGGPDPQSATGGTANAPLASDSFLNAPEDLTEDPPDPEPVPEPTAFPESPSCEGTAEDACQDESCCKREGVATAEVMQVAANISVSLSPFLMDKFEVTVGRFRNFSNAYNDWREAGNPASGAGAHPETEGSGWNRDPAWESDLAGGAAVLKLNLACNANQQTWTDEPGNNELRPINCVSWYEAFAFCIWDEGRLSAVRRTASLPGAPPR
jgi:hypothetical protein